MSLADTIYNYVKEQNIHSIYPTTEKIEEYILATMEATKTGIRSDINGMVENYENFAKYQKNYDPHKEGDHRLYLEVFNEGYRAL